MPMEKYDCLKLENQLCFPLYVAAKEVVRKYKPFLDELDLTYTQYIAMMVMWQEKKVKVTELCNKLYLDTGTISPLVRKLKAKGYINLYRDPSDERIQVVEITKDGEELKEKALLVPAGMAKSKCVDITLEEAVMLRKILTKIINK